MIPVLPSVVSSSLRFKIADASLGVIPSYIVSLVPTVSFLLGHTDFSVSVALWVALVLALCAFDISLVGLRCSRASTATCIVE